MTNTIKKLKPRLEAALEATLQQIADHEKELDTIRESGDLEKVDDWQWKNEELHQKCRQIRKYIEKQKALEEAIVDFCFEVEDYLFE